MSRYVAREFGHEVTHVVESDSTQGAVHFGAPYRRVDGRALCGKDVEDGVVMPDNYKVKCRVCRFAEREREVGNLPDD